LGSCAAHRRNPRSLRSRGGEAAARRSSDEQRHSRPVSNPTVILDLADGRPTAAGSS
jgi:hypothetical protein